MLAPLTRDRFLRLSTPRPFNELRLSVSLKELGIATPAVAAAVVYTSGLIYRGEVAREEIADAADLSECLFKSKLSEPLRSDALSATGRLIGSLHRAGVVHPDLNIRNVLICWADDPLDAYILDIEKCVIVARLSQRMRRGMLNRFHRSIRKFEASSGQRLSGGEWDEFLAAYALAFAG
jgi:3-deoxy-D-manno-octulosonic acid kinase